MPVLSWGHSQYWQTQSTVVAPPAATNVISYPRWMTTVTIGSGLGGLHGVWESWLHRTGATRDRRQS